MDDLREMKAFAAVVDQGNFTDAAKKMGISKSTVSKHVTSLEARLGVRLLHRTTRRVSPTEIGLAYCDCVRRVLSASDKANSIVANLQSKPSGPLRIYVATDFGINYLSPVLSELSGFFEDFPDISVNVVLGNQYVDLKSEDFDMAIHIGEIEDSTLSARKLIEVPKRMIAAPMYLAKHGHPRKIDDLNSHKLLHFSNDSNGNMWKLTSPSGERRLVCAAGWLSVNDGQSLLNAAISGLGIAYLPRFLYADAMKRGLIEEVIPELPLKNQVVYALYPPGDFRQPKIHAFIDYLSNSLSKMN